MTKFLDFLLAVLVLFIVVLFLTSLVITVAPLVYTIYPLSHILWKISFCLTLVGFIFILWLRYDLRKMGRTLDALNELKPFFDFLELLEKSNKSTSSNKQPYSHSYTSSSRNTDYYSNKQGEKETQHETSFLKEKIIAPTITGTLVGCILRGVSWMINGEFTAVAGGAAIIGSLVTIMFNK